MSNENQFPQSDTSPSAPKGADLIPAQENEGEKLEPELDLLEKVERIAYETAQQTAAVVVSEMHTGPMPSARTYREYEQVLPGTALVIRNEFQANGLHVRTMEDRGQLAEIEGDKQNRKVAERLVWASLFTILVLALTGHEKVAIAVAVTTVVAVITGFLRQRAAPKNGKPPDKPSEDESV
jgi:uncharacterized membrane protein